MVVIDNVGCIRRDAAPLHRRQISVLAVARTG